MIGVLTLAAYAGLGDGGIDRFVLGQSTQPTQSILPGRPAPTTALGLVLLGAALLLMLWGHNKAIWAAQFFAVLAGLDALRVLLGYLYYISGLAQGALVPGVALPSICLLLLSVGVLALRPYQGLVKLLLGDDLAGIALRRLVFSIITITLIVELAHTLLRWEALFGVGFTVVVLISAIALATMSIVHALARVDRTQRENEARYRTLVELSPDAIYVHRNEQILYYNSMLGRLLQVPPGETLIGSSIWSLFHPDDHALIRERLQQMCQPSQRVAPIEERLLRRDGEIIAVEVSASAISDAGQTAVLVVVHDISERKRLQAQLGHAQRMESIGRLAGGVAHDFNNLLSIVIGCASLAAESLPEKHPVQDDLREIQAVSDRAKTLIRQLLLFARREPTLPQRLNLNELVQGIEHLLRRLLPKSVQLVSKQGADLKDVLADPSQLEQVLVNLVVNARDAMPNGGSITIETANVVLDEAYLNQHIGANPGRHALLAISDTGLGMSAEVQQRAFEPFFSTKPQGEGTGLGLATCYGIVKQHGGNIWIYSELGYGTTVKVYLPSIVGETDDLAPVQPTADIEAASHLRGHETVLLVEDTEAVRRLVTRTLELYGYVVLQAADGSEALRLASLVEQPVSLLLTDLVLLDMRGSVLAETLIARWPKLRVLFMSGYTDPLVTQQEQAIQAAAYLEKPFSPTTLVRRVRELLDVY